ncbi:hypothetical protein [Bradyrhizobium sp.]|uniref:hypothetical protein n=1 Tax=Bradyrhizobium sp. TaxID=376 RepID=UPI0025C1026E|nr:hypothetical protein [Bradyrhizobium sp.]
MTGNTGEEDRVAADEWAAAIRAGDFDRAWAISDRNLNSHRGECGDKHDGPRHQQRIWRGEMLSGQRVLVRCYHGLGDTIQFIRFAKPLRQLAREVIVWCQPELLSLVGRVEGVDRAIALHDGTPEVDFDTDIEIMELPHAIKATRDQVEMREPYLRLGPCGAAPRDRGLAVGVAWEVGDWDKRRSIPPAELRRIRLPGVRLFSLQRGDGAAAVDEIGAIDISTPDIEALGHRLRTMDIVVCPDTMIAHLSAALGCETWVMLHSDCDWRWPKTGSTALWYPSVRLFRQAKPGDWRGVVDEVQRAIEDMMSAAPWRFTEAFAREPSAPPWRAATTEHVLRRSSRADADNPDRNAPVGSGLPNP